jgi:hypothetical protein
MLSAENAEQPSVNCPRCLSDDIHRCRRRGSLDKIRAAFNRWPYYCGDCGLKFHEKGRHPESENAKTNPTSEKPEAAPAAGPVMAFRKDEVRPQAKVVIEADSHEQLSRILMALDRAVVAYQRQAEAEREFQGQGRR